ncbi:MAG: hypothetical protein QXG39_06655, partial [Candidatus Aenigmatarchaeota archaeon]
EDAIQKLSSMRNAPKSVEGIKTYLQQLGEALILRELGVESIFPNVGYDEIVEKLKWPIKKIFEKSGRKFILVGEVKDKMVGIHPFIVYFCDSLKGDYLLEDDHLYKKIDVVVSHGPKLMGFEGVEIYLPLMFLEDPWNFYIAFNEKDLDYLGLRSEEERNEITANYKIKERLDSLSIEILKPEEPSLKVILNLPEIFSEIKEDVNELRKLVGSDFEPYIKVQMKREKLMGELEEACLENENFYKELIEARKADEYIPPDLPLNKSDSKEFKKLYEVALIEIEDYIERREREMEEKRKKIMERLMK